jgi:hypothetical protein
MAQLPADSPYRSTMRRGFLEAMAVLWRNASSGRANDAVAGYIVRQKR